MNRGLLWLGWELSLLVLWSMWLQKVMLHMWVCTEFWFIVSLNTIFKILFQRSKRKFEAQQIRMFSNLMRASFSYVKEMNVYETLYYFSANLFNALKPYSYILRRIIFITLSITILGLVNYWTIFVPVILIILTVILYKLYYLTVAHFYSHELNTRKSIYRNIRNNLAGRAVLQSFDKLHDFSLS